MIGMLARSKAGHDKDMLYVIIEEDKECVYLSDGRLRTLDRLKKKKKKHIQIIRHIPDSGILDKIRRGHQVTNEEIKRMIKISQDKNQI